MFALWRRTALAGALLALIGAPSGCDGGPAFETRVEVFNNCSVDVLVVASGDADEFAGLGVTQGDSNAVAPGESDPRGHFVMTSTIESALTVWVVGVGDQSYDRSVTFMIDDLPTWEDERGITWYAVTIEGDVCPE